MPPSARTPRISLQTARSSRPDMVAVPIFEGVPPTAPKVPAATAIEIARLAKAGFKGEAGQTRLGTLTDGTAVLVCGFGKAAQADLRGIQQGAAKIWSMACASASRTLAVVVPDLPLTRTPGGAEAVVRGLSLAGYRYDAYRSRRPDDPAPSEIRLIPPAGSEAVYREALLEAPAAARAIGYARDLANTPPNIATPRWMASKARELARRHGMRIQILGPKELKARGMGGILAVGAGSSEESRLVRLEWGSGPLTIALVGKGVTFDTGGISIKPAAAMDEMKYDKCGACTVLGVMAAAAELDLPLRLRAYLPLVENMPGGSSYRPGDIIRCHNGKTVEIINTDAEGRLILADALSWASAENPDALLTYATLTGACVVALGNSGAGLFTPNDGLSAELLTAADSAGERLWRLPLWPEFGAEMKGTHADLRNQGSRWGGASSAAAFLSNFVGDLERWAHLDIAGPAYVGADGSGAKGATGYGVATTLAWLRAQRAPPPK